MNRLRFNLDAAGRRAAVRLWPPYARKRRALCRHLQQLFAQQQIDAVFDVGANRGQYYRFLRYEVGFRGAIVSFEPIAALSAELAAQARHDPLWQVESCALGAVDERRELNVMARHSFSSLLKPDASATAEFADKNVVAHVEPIEVKCLDGIYAALAQRFGFSRVYLKLDTQGHDLAVIDGARACLANVRGLQSELSFVPIYAGMPSWDESVSTIVAAGFSVSAFFPVSNASDLRLIEADGIFIRSSAGTQS